jgi:hypothetical protein
VLQSHDGEGHVFHRGPVAPVQKYEVCIAALHRHGPFSVHYLHDGVPCCRNALWSSRGGGTRYFVLPGPDGDLRITWEHVKEIFDDDVARRDNGQLSLVPRLKKAAVVLNSYFKMNVGFVRQVFDTRMIAAMGGKGDDWAGTIGYMTAVRAIFEDVLLSKTPIRDMSDCRFSVIQSALAWFTTWYARHRAAVAPGLADGSLTKSEAQKFFLAYQTWRNLQVTVEGFMSYCRYFFQRHGSSGHYIVPLRINQSSLESIFGRVRQMCGANQNPTEVIYKRAIACLPMLSEGKLSSKHPYILSTDFMLRH